MKHQIVVLSAALSLLSAGAVRADIMPSFATVPTNWSTDRYAPASFTNVGTYQGRNNVLGITIAAADSLAGRLPGFNSSFYNTQGMGHAITGGAGSEIDADLYIPTAWSDPATNGNVRTDMWGVMPNSSTTPDYPIIGFTNYGPTPRFRVWNESIGWVDLATPVVFGAWTSFAIQYDGTNINYSINGNQVYSYVEDPTTVGFSSVIMQGYNFGDPTLAPGANVQDYTAHWSNASVPEPGILLLLAGMGIGIATIRRKLQA